VCEVKGYGRQKSYLDEYRGSEYSMAYLPKVEIALWVDDPHLDEVVRTIIEVARTGRMGDGKIFVLPTQETIPAQALGAGLVEWPEITATFGSVDGTRRVPDTNQADGRR
jgi:nitrogen regulatory protein PII